MEHEGISSFFELMTAPVGRQVEFTPEVVETVLTPPDVDNEGAGGVGQDEEDEG